MIFVSILVIYVVASYWYYIYNVFKFIYSILYLFIEECPYMMISNVNKKNFSTTETILQQLRNDINNLHYNDQFITEAEVSSRFQVSRTPAREALNILCQEGILEKSSPKGLSNP